MLEHIHHLQDRWSGEREGEEEARLRQTDGFGALQVFAAQLLLLTGIGSTLDAFARGREAEDDSPVPGPEPQRGGSLAATWAPVLFGPLAAVAHLRHVTSPSASTARATRVLDAAVIGAGVAALVEALVSTRRSGDFPSLTPVALASAGVLGLMLERQAQEVAAERERLERRASVVERLVPKRRPKLDRIVVHV